MRVAYNRGAILPVLLPMAASALSTPTLLTHFPSTVRIENLTILPNSTIVVCNSFTGELFGINPLHGAPGADPYYITSVAPFSSAIFGLASPEPYTVAATASNFTWDPPSLSPGTNAVHHITLSKTGPKTTTFAIPSAGWLNGLTSVPGASHYLLIADCLAGALLRLDTRSGSVATVSSDPLFAPILTEYLPIGINGVHALDGWLYFTNTNLGLYGRMAITDEGLAVGTPAEIITYGINGSTYDDFALRKDGVGFLATGLGALNGIEKVTESGDASMVASWEFESPNISQPVSGVFGQTRGDRGTLYFATSGEYLGGTQGKTGAQVFALQVGC